MLLHILALAYAAHTVVVKKDGDVHTETADDYGSMKVQGLGGRYSYFKEGRGGRDDWWVMATKGDVVLNCEQFHQDVPVASSILREINPSACELHSMNQTVRGMDAYCLMQTILNKTVMAFYASDTDAPLQLVVSVPGMASQVYDLYSYKETNDTEPLVLPLQCIHNPPNLVSPEKYSGTLEVITEDTVSTESLTMWRNVIFESYESQANSGGYKKLAYTSALELAELALWDAPVDIRRSRNMTVIESTRRCNVPASAGDLHTSSDAFFNDAASSDLDGSFGNFLYEGQQTVRDQECYVWSLDQRATVGFRVYFYVAALKWQRRNTLVAVYMDGSHTYELAKWQGINAVMQKSHHMHFFKARVGPNIRNPEILESCSTHDLCHNTCIGITCKQEVQLAFQLKVLVGSVLATFVVSFVVTLLAILLMARPSPVVQAPQPPQPHKELGTSAPPPCLPMPAIRIQELIYETDDSSL